MHISASLPYRLFVPTRTNRKWADVKETTPRNNAALSRRHDLPQVVHYHLDQGWSLKPNKLHDVHKDETKNKTNKQIKGKILFVRDIDAKINSATSLVIKTFCAGAQFKDTKSSNR